MAFSVGTARMRIDQQMLKYGQHGLLDGVHNDKYIDA